MSARSCERSEDLPWVLVGGPDWVGLEHPQVVELAPAADPKGAPLGRVVLFREEDYMERGDDGWKYVGLLPLELNRRLVEDGEDEEEEEAWNGPAEEESGEKGEELSRDCFFGRQFTWPELVPCPACPGEAVIADNFVQDDCAGYVCEDCEVSLFAERREGMINAAVLFLLEDSEPAKK